VVGTGQPLINEVVVVTRYVVMKVVKVDPGKTATNKRLDLARPLMANLFRYALCLQNNKFCIIALFSGFARSGVDQCHCLRIQYCRDLSG
jgi:hypothetical protein